MSKRQSIEAQFLNWIDTASVEVVQSIMGIANARLKARTKSTNPLAPRKVRADKGTQRPAQSAIV